MRICIPVSEKEELDEVVRRINLLIEKYPSFSEEGRKVLSAVCNYQNCDMKQGDYFRNRLLAILEKLGRAGRLQLV